MTGRRCDWVHELKNQIGIILGFTEILIAERDTADPHRRDLMEIHAAATRALELVASRAPIVPTPLE
jgi:hypothetical protein